MRHHTLGVAAVEGTEATAPVTVVEHRHDVGGVWLIPDDSDALMFQGKAVGEFARTDQVATYTVLGGEEVDIIYGRTGRSGAFTGGVDSRQDVPAVLDRIEGLAASRRRVHRMVWGSQSIRVRIADLDITPHDEMQPNNLKHRVRFRFVQVGD